MDFSHEEKLIWNNSEVMRELEKIAQNGGLEVPPEAYLPLESEEPEEEPAWEEETDEKKLMDAIEELENPELVNLEAQLIDNLRKLAYYLATDNRKKEAFQVECAVRNIQDTSF